MRKSIFFNEIRNRIPDWELTLEREREKESSPFFYGIRQIVGARKTTVRTLHQIRVAHFNFRLSLKLFNDPSRELPLRLKIIRVVSPSSDRVIS